MHKEKVLEIAKRSGMDIVMYGHFPGFYAAAQDGKYLFAFAAAIEAATREECAKLCDQSEDNWRIIATIKDSVQQADLYEARRWAAHDLARAIRNMGKEG